MRNHASIHIDCIACTLTGEIKNRELRGVNLSPQSREKHKRNKREARLGASVEHIPMKAVGCLAVGVGAVLPWQHELKPRICTRVRAGVTRLSRGGTVL